MGEDVAVKIQQKAGGEVFVGRFSDDRDVLRSFGIFDSRVTIRVVGERDEETHVGRVGLSIGGEELQRYGKIIERRVSF